MARRAGAAKLAHAQGKLEETSQTPRDSPDELHESAAVFQYPQISTVLMRERPLMHQMIVVAV